MNRLVLANAALIGAIAIHGYDHFRQERGVDALNTEVIAGGQVVAVLAVISLVLSVRRHPRAAHVAAGVGLWIAAGVTASHFVPEWSAFSDPYSGLGLDAFSWFAAALEVAAAVTLAVVAFLSLRRRPALTEGMAQT